MVESVNLIFCLVGVTLMGVERGRSGTLLGAFNILVVGEISRERSLK